MTDSKLIELLQTFSKAEFRHFQDYYHSPYFNKHEQVIALGDYLLKVAPKFKASKLAKAKIHKILYPNKPYNDNLLASVINKLLNLAYDFLAMEAQPAAVAPSKEILSLRSLRERKLEKHYRSISKKAHRKIKQAPFSSSKQALQQFYNQEEEDLWFLTQGGRSYHEALQEQSNQLDVFYWIEKLKLACDMTNRNRVVKADYNCQMIREIEDFLTVHPAWKADYPVLELYLSCLQLLRLPSDEARYRKLKDLLQVVGPNLHANDLKPIYDYALNYCVLQINAGKLNYYQEVLYLYRMLLTNELIFVDGYLPAWEYKNIVTAAVRTQQFDWASQFIEDYRKKLPRKVRDNAYRYNQASLYYAKGQHKEALQALFNVEFTDSTYYLGAKIIQLKSYYELEEWEAMKSLLEAFAAYLRRSKDLSDYRKAANEHLIQVARHLCRLNEQKDWISTEKFAKKYQQAAALLDQLEPLANKEWLRQQLEDLEFRG